MNTRALWRATKSVAWMAVGVCCLAGCSGDETPNAKPSSRPSVTEATPAAPRHLAEQASAPLAAGTYLLWFLTDSGAGTVDARVDVPDGYDESSDWYVVSHDGHQFLGLFVVSKVDRDACASGKAHQFDPGPSVQDLADALVAQKSTRASAPEPVTLAGHEGLYVELASPRDISRCEDTGSLWNGRGIYGDGQVDQVWILDVDGQRVVVDASYSEPDSDAADLDELSAMVSSLEFPSAG